jgi:hypothetical protein
VPISTRSTSTTKRVRIASPPVPISPETPASYASSPEETRYANLLGSPPVTNSGAVPYALALASNPFLASSSDGERDDVDEQLLENTRRNSTLGSKTEHGGRNTTPDPVKEALARFSGPPRRSTAPSPYRSGGGNELQWNQPARPALDVDAFKRLLLTGEPGWPVINSMVPAATHPSSQAVIASDSSSSNADSASVSQHSIFEPQAPILAETPRTSYELDREEPTSERAALLAADATTDKKPSVPKPRHGKLLNNILTTPSPATLGVTQAIRTSAIPALENFGVSSPSDLNKPLPSPPTDNSFPPQTDPIQADTLQSHNSLRRAPTPPLTRRGSQHRSQSMQESSNAFQKRVSAGHPGAASSPEQGSAITAFKAPPPPPARRQKRASGIGLPSFEGSVQEEEEEFNPTPTRPKLSPSPSMTSLSQSKPQPPPSRNPSLAKRLSRVSTGSSIMPPPLPPPRRVRGSSRSSSDSQNIALPLGLNSSNEIRRSSTDSHRNVSSQQPTSNNILADLAALQMEVDALRKREEHEASATT